jgi:hypothetical protein
MVPESRRHATSDVWPVSENALRLLSLVCGTRRDRASASARLYDTGSCPSDWAGGVDHFSRVAAQCRHPQRRPEVSRDDGAMARGAISPSAKAGEACAQPSPAGLANPYLGIALALCSRERICQPDHGPPDLVLLSDDGTGWHIDPHHDFGVGVLTTIQRAVAKVFTPMAIVGKSFICKGIQKQMRRLNHVQAPKRGQALAGRGIPQVLQNQTSRDRLTCHRTVSVS